MIPSFGSVSLGLPVLAKALPLYILRYVHTMHKQMSMRFIFQEWKTNHEVCSEKYNYNRQMCTHEYLGKQLVSESWSIVQVSSNEHNCTCTYAESTYCSTAVRLWRYTTLHTLPLLMGVRRSILITTPACLFVIPRSKSVWQTPCDYVGVIGHMSQDSCCITSGQCGTTPTPPQPALYIHTTPHNLLIILLGKLILHCLHNFFNFSQDTVPPPEVQEFPSFCHLCASASVDQPFT